MTRLQDNAKVMLSYFTTKTRTNGDEFCCTIDNTPQNITDIIHKCHNDMMPDDWKYKFIVEALNIIIDNEDPDMSDIESDIYTSDLTSWLNSNNTRLEYVNEAMTEYGSIKDAFNMLSTAQWVEKEEVFNILLDEL